MSEQTTSETTSSAPEMPENVRKVFDDKPEVQMVLLEMGHGWGKAKYAGRCPVSGLHISIGSQVRKLHVWARNGRHFDGYAHGEACAALNFVGGVTLEYPGVSGWSFWRRWTPDWLAELGDLAALPVGTKIWVKEAGDFGFTDKSWYKRAENQWEGGERGYSHSSDKQLAASFKRRTRAFIWKLHLPGAVH